MTPTPRRGLCPGPRADGPPSQSRRRHPALVQRVALVSGLFVGHGSKSPSPSAPRGSPSRHRALGPTATPVQRLRGKRGLVADLAPGGLDLVVTLRGLTWAFCPGLSWASRAPKGPGPLADTRAEGWRLPAAVGAPWTPRAGGSAFSTGGPRAAGRRASGDSSVRAGRHPEPGGSWDRSPPPTAARAVSKTGDAFPGEQRPRPPEVSGGLWDCPAGGAGTVTAVTAVPMGPRLEPAGLRSPRPRASAVALTSAQGPGMSQATS